MKQGFTYFQARRLIGEANPDIDELVHKMLTPPDLEFDGVVIDALHDNVWGVGSEYFHSRNITDESITKFKLGYSAKQCMVTVPVHSPTGVLWGFVARSVVGKVFKNNRGLQKSLTLFNMHRVWTSPKVFVVESSFDAIRLDQLELPAVATLGAGISNAQIDLLKRTFDDIILIPDNDDGGKLMTDRLSKGIPSIQILRLDGSVKDVGNLSDDDLTSLV
jgi:DNA primase